MGHSTSSKGASVSLLELTENKGHFITKVFISIQFTNQLVHSGACVCSQEGDCGQTPWRMGFPRAQTSPIWAEVWSREGGGRASTHFLPGRKGACLGVSEGDALEAGVSQ